MTFNPNNQNEEPCYCQHCSEEESFEAIDIALEKLLKTEDVDEMIDILLGLSEFSKMIGVREYIFTNMIDQGIVLDSLKDFTYKEDFTFNGENEIGEADIYSEFDDVVEASLDTKGKQNRKGYWNTPFNS